MKKRNRKTERNMAICSRREEGASYRQIAEEYGISIIRVRQILEEAKKREREEFAKRYTIPDNIKDGIVEAYNYMADQQFTRIVMPIGDRFFTLKITEMPADIDKWWER